MKLKWTQHARDVFEKRKIPRAWIERTVIDPDKTLPDDIDTELLHYLKVIQEYENRVLRVIINKSSEPPRLITFYFDRKMKGKL